MNQPGENVRFLNSGDGLAEQVVLPPGAADASRKLLDVFRARQSRQGSFGVAQPDKAPADQTTWLGGRKHSVAARKHNERLDDIEFAKIEVEYAVRQGLALEYICVDEGTRAVIGMVDIFRSVPGNSLESALAQEFVLNGSDHVRRILSDASELFIRRALR